MDILLGEGSYGTKGRFGCRPFASQCDLKLGCFPLLGRKSLLTYQSSILVHSGINQRVMLRAPLKALSRKPGQADSPADQPADHPRLLLLHTFILSPPPPLRFCSSFFCGATCSPHSSSPRSPPSLTPSSGDGSSRLTPSCSEDGRGRRRR